MKIVDLKKRWTAIPQWQKVIPIIQESIDPDSWKQPGNSIMVQDGELVVQNCDRMKKQVEEFIAKVKQHNGIMIVIETRLLMGPQDSREQWRIVWN